MHGAWIPLFVVLWLVVILLVVFVTGLIRRIGALEARQSERQRHQSGPKIGFPAPIVDGHERLRETDGSLRGRIVVFLSSTSAVAGAFTRELQRALSDERGSEIGLVLVLDAGTTEGLTDLGATALVVEDDHKLAAAWDIPGTPFAVVLDRDGLVRAGTFVKDAGDVSNLARLLAETVPMSTIRPVASCEGAVSAARIQA